MFSRPSPHPSLHPSLHPLISLSLTHSHCCFSLRRLAHRHKLFWYNRDVPSWTDHWRQGQPHVPNKQGCRVLSRAHYLPRTVCEEANGAHPRRCHKQRPRPVCGRPAHGRSPSSAKVWRGRARAQDLPPWRTSARRWTGVLPVLCGSMLDTAQAHGARAHQARARDRVLYASVSADIKPRCRRSSWRPQLVASRCVRSAPTETHHITTLPHC